MAGEKDDDEPSGGVQFGGGAEFTEAAEDHFEGALFYALFRGEAAAGDDLEEGVVKRVDGCDVGVFAGGGGKRDGRDPVEEFDGAAGVGREEEMNDAGAEM